MQRLFLICLLIYCADALAWEKVEQEEGIEVFSRSKADSDFLQFKLVTKLEAEFGKAVAAMHGEDACLEWSRLCEKGQVLEQMSKSEQVNYLILDFPWPFSHRHGAWHISRKLDDSEGVFVMQMRALPERVLQNNYELLVSSGSYKLTKHSEQQTNFEWIIHSDPGGNIKASMANKRTPQSLIGDVKALQELLSK